MNRSAHPSRLRGFPLRLEQLESRELLNAAALLDLPMLLPPQFDLTNQSGFLTGPSAAPALEIAQGFLRSQSSRLGLTTADLGNLLVTRNYVSDLTGTTHLTFQQTLHGLPIFNANITMNVTARGEIINAAGGFVPQLGRLAATAPTLSPIGAVAAAAAQLDVPLVAAPVAVAAAGTSFTVIAPGASQDEVTVGLQYLALPDRSVVLTWNLALHTLDEQHWYNTYVHAGTGQVLSVIDWVSHFDDREHAVADAHNQATVPPGEQPGLQGDGASYRVYSRWVPSPDWGDRLVEYSPYDPLGSPYGWHDTNGVPGPEFTDTRGNNVDARRSNVRPSGGPTLTFDFPINFAQQPATYLPAATANLFYWNNFLHDVHYRYGFTPSAGNFQTNTYSQGGIGNDRVNANAQSASGMNNATFSTPPDGSSGTMNMFLWNRTNPNRDGDLDNMIVVHEYGHGVSNRLTGNANGLGNIQSGGMGEGWGDWWGLMFTQYWGESPTWGTPLAPYVLGQEIFGPGIRRYPYSFNMQINPLTLGWYNSTQAVHRTGEIWCSALWDMNHLLIEKYGFNLDYAYGYTGEGDAGNLLALRLVMDGLKLQPINPSLLQARNAIVNADLALTGGQNRLEIWTAFARRGFGYSAVDGGSASRVVTEAFDLPPDLGPGRGAPGNPDGGVVSAIRALEEKSPNLAPPLAQGLNREQNVPPTTLGSVDGSALVLALRQDAGTAFTPVAYEDNAAGHSAWESAAWDLFAKG